MFLPLRKIQSQALKENSLQMEGENRDRQVQDSVEEKENLNRWMSVFPVSIADPYLTIKISISGFPDPVIGYLIDIRTLDRWVSDAVLESLEQFYCQSENQENIEWSLTDWFPLLFQSAKNRIQAETPFECDSLELAFSPFLRFCLRPNVKEPVEMPSVVVTEQFEFSAAHRLHCKELSDEENQKLFGKCNHPSGHGHNYRLEVSCQVDTPSVSNPDQPELWQWLNEIVSSEVLDRLDHKFLNIDLPEFSDLNPSVENIAAVVHSWLLPHFDSKRKLVGVRLYETEKTWADVGF